MYSKQEASQMRQEFWTAFGKYMQPILSYDGEKINWVNYKTGEKDIYFRMNADNKKASVTIEITHSDSDIQALYLEQFQQLKPLLQQALQEEWTWQHYMLHKQNKPVSSIYKELDNVSVFNKNDWPQLISFFKPRIIAFDEFWSTAKYVFEAMR